MNPGRLAALGSVKYTFGSGRTCGPGYLGRYLSLLRMKFMQNWLIAIAALMICASPQRLIAQPKEEQAKVKGHQQDGFLAQKLAPFATEVYRPKAWFFWQESVGGDFTWIISKKKLGEANRQFEMGVEIKAFYDVSTKAKKSPEDFAAEYLKTKIEREKMKIVHRAKKTVGPLTAFTQTIELADGILATDLYWGDGKKLDVVVVVTRRAPKKQWNASQRLFGNLTRFSLPTMVQGTRDKPPIDAGKNK